MSYRHRAGEAFKHPNLLVLSGYLYRQSGNLSAAIGRAEEAIASAKDSAASGEYHFVAQTHLAFYLAMRGEQRDRDRALQCARAAADQVDTFSNRHSFVINYGYVQLRFARTRDELEAAWRYLLKVAAREDLDDVERTEAASYIADAAARLKE